MRHPSPIAFPTAAAALLMLLLLQVTSVAVGNPLDPASSQSPVSRAWCAAKPDGMGINRKLTREPLPTRCYDGTGAGYYDSGYFGAETCLVVFFEGGNFCATQHDCQERQNSNPEQFTSSHQPNQKPALSILSASHPQFGCCRAVWLPYCSQDLFSGSGSAMTDTGGRVYFEGFSTVENMFARLNISTPGGLANAYTSILLAGVGAGAIGASLHATTIGRRYWQTAGAEKIFLLADSGWFVESLPLFKATQLVSPMARIRSGPALWNSSDNIVLACPLSPVFRCYQLNQLSPYIAVNAMYLESLHNVLYLGEATGDDLNDLSVDSAMITFLDGLSGAVQQSVYKVTLPHIISGNR